MRHMGGMVIGLLIPLSTACLPLGSTFGDGGADGGTSDGGTAPNFKVDPSCQSVNGVDRTAAVAAAAPEAIRLAKSGVTFFDDPSKFGLGRYTYWFGPWSQIVPDGNGPFPEQPRIESNVRLIANSISKWKFEVVCRPDNYWDGEETQCKKPTDYAWVNEMTERQGPYHINLCPQVFNLPAKGVNSQASTIVHEVSHLIENMLTKENGAALEDRIDPNAFSYDLVQFASYSSSSPFLAYNDACAHEFFLGSDPGKP